MLFIVLLALFAFAIADEAPEPSTTADETPGHIDCEEVDSEKENEELGKLKSCELIDKTEIEVPGVTLSTAQDDDMRAIRFFDNKKIFFLPVDVYKSFPYLVLYFGHSCNIKAISKENFAHLTKLRELHLDNNRIQKIEADTFEGLKSVQVIYLSKNDLWNSKANL